jgi:BASS family bile acid:Na+ symporter
MEANIVTQVVLPLCLFIIMAGMGMSLVLSDFSRVLLYPKAVIIGLCGQLLLLPVCGFLIAAFFVSDPVLALGIMLLSVCPGGTTSNLVTHLAKGDLALSITLTAVSSLFTFISIPLVMALAFEYFSNEQMHFKLPVMQTIGGLFLVTILPVSIGMAIRNFKPQLALKLEKHLNRFAMVFLVVLVLGIGIQQHKVLIEALQHVGPSVFMLNVISMMIGFMLARWFKLNIAQTTSISLEIGIQNSTLAMLIATTLLQSPEMALPPAIYSMVMFLTGGFVMVLGIRRKETPEEKARNEQANASLHGSSVNS